MKSFLFLLPLMQLTPKKFLFTFFLIISLYFIVNFSTSLYKNSSDSFNFSIDNQLKSESSLIQDHINPFCDGIEYKLFTNLKNENIEVINIDIFDKEKWYENLINLVFEKVRIINPKYKDKFDAEIAIKYQGNYECKFDGVVKISGDWNDHINKENLISSLDVHLKNGNVGGVTKFKLFIPNTRNGDNEIVVTTLLEESGFISPRTFYVNVGLTNFNNDYLIYPYIFQEKFSKEMIEYNNLREAPIYETNESFRWDEVLKKTLHLDGSKPLMISKSLNGNWATRGLSNKVIAIEGIERFNKAIFNSYDAESQLNYNYLGNNKEVFYEFDAASLALLTEHAMTNHNRKFYFNKIEDQFYPIYYDGDSNIIELGHIRGRSDYLERNNLSFGAISLLSDLSINYEKVFNKLTQRGLTISKAESDEFINKYINNLNLISDYEQNSETIFNDFYINNKNINYSDDFKYIFYDANEKLVEVCNFDLSKCDITQGEISNEELFSSSVSFSNIEGYLLGKSKSTFLNQNLAIQENQLKIDEIDIQITGSPEIEIDHKHKKINIFFNHEYDRVKFLGPGKLSNWAIKADSNLNSSDEPERLDQSLLTGCITLYNLTLENVKFTSKKMVCEDALNIINSSGNLESLLIQNSSFDGLDIDFSNITIKNIKVVDSGNDCIDLSSGKYFLQFLDLSYCSDKSISIGEKSNVEISELFSNISEIGIAVKDSSTAILQKASVLDTSMCLAVYRKKQEFGPSSLRIEQLNCEAKNENYIQKGSSLEIGK